MPWTIVTFTESNEIEAVPEKWYNEELGIVYYPQLPKKEVERAIKNEYEPDVEHWTVYQAKLFHHMIFLH